LALFEAIEDGFCIIEMKFDGDRPVDYRFVEVNPAFPAQTGLEDAQGRWMRDIAPGHEQHWFDAYGRVATTGEPLRFEHFARELGRWFEVYAFRVGDPAARQVAVLFSDKTDRKEREDQRQAAEETQAVLNQELSHRMKNMLAMVQAIATQSLRGVSERDLVAAFLQRIHALGRAHDVLLAQNWTAARLSDLVEAVLASFPAAGRFEASGPVVMVGPRASLSVSLLLFELATNALKYGALSAEAGRVAVRWRLEGPDGSEALLLDWVEAGGPAVEPPDQYGFGSKLIRMGLIGTGGAELSFQSSGLTAQFTAPLVEVQQK
jgi:two-component sensor histidine kinase